MTLTTTRQPAPVAWPLTRHEDLFREPMYADGGPYDNGDEEDEPEGD